MTNDIPSHREDIIGEWSEDKLQLLEKYLKAYSDIMSSQKKSWLKAYHYVDAFAGSGKPKARSDEERFVAGSPLRALQCMPQFDHYWFIELSPWRINKLNHLKTKFSALRIEIIQGDCNKALLEQIIPKVTWKSKQRGFVFLDPYGLQVDFETVRALAEAKTFDIFVNFPIMAITRQLKRNELPSESIQLLLNKVLGNTEWISEIYKPSPQLPLFGNQTMERSVIQAQWLAHLYSLNMANLFRNVSKPVIMKNSKNAPLYALFLASQKPNAIKIADSIFDRFERLRGIGK